MGNNTLHVFHWRQAQQVGLRLNICICLRRGAGLAGVADIGALLGYSLALSWSVQAKICQRNAEATPCGAKVCTRQSQLKSQAYENLPQRNAKRSCTECENSYRQRVAAVVPFHTPR